MPILSFMHWLSVQSCVSDTSNVSIGDLENIQETDTPPQSPTDSQPSVGDTVTIKMPTESPAKVHYKKYGEAEKTEETDVDSSSPTSKVTRRGAALTQSHSPPRAPSPTSRQSSPSKSPVKQRLASRLSQSPPRVGSPTEELARLSREQTRRIAEYGGSSPTEVREVAGSPMLHRNSHSKPKSFRQVFGHNSWHAGPVLYSNLPLCWCIPATRCLGYNLGMLGIFCAPVCLPCISCLHISG